MRTDDGSNQRLRRYLFIDGNSFAQEDTYFYGNPIISTLAEAPLAPGQLLSANPLSSGSMLRLSDLAPGSRVTLLDVQGRSISNWMAADGSLEFAWPKVPTGTYALSVSSAGFASRAWLLVGQ